MKPIQHQELTATWGVQECPAYDNPEGEWAGMRRLPCGGAGKSARDTWWAADPSCSRRQFLAATAGLVVAGCRSLSGVAESEQAAGLVDVNVSLGRWPTRRVYGDELPELVELLRSHGVTQGWVGSLDGLLHKNMAAVNRRLAQRCASQAPGLLLPFGSINPTLPEWEEDLRRCAEDLRMPGIRLHPNYHGYPLEDPRFGQLLRMAADRGLLVQLSLVMEDERMMHPLTRVEPVSTSVLAATVRAISGLRLILLNALRTLGGEALQKLAEVAYVEIGMQEGVGGVAKLLEIIPVGRVLFGSHAPMFYLDSALLKLKESQLTGEQLAAIRARTAQGLLA